MLDPRLLNRIRESLQLGRSPADIARAVRLWKEASALARPVSWHEVLSRGPFYALFHPYAEQSRYVTSLLRQSDKVCCLAVTLGEEVEQRAGNYRERGETFKAQALDKMGGLLLEAEMQRFHVALSFKWGRKGFRTTSRFRPGDRDFALGAEQTFVELGKEHGATLFLGPDQRLRPRNTKIGLFGLVPDKESSS